MDNHTEEPKPTIPLLDLPGSERLKAHREREARGTYTEAELRQAFRQAEAKAKPTGWRTPTEQIADIILRDVEQAPMSYISDGGERARHTAHHIRLIAELETRNRIIAVLTTLETAVADGRTQAEQQAEEKRNEQHPASLAYTQGRAAAYTRVLQAIAEARQQVANPTGRTRAENAQAFAEAVINTITPAGDTQ